MMQWKRNSQWFRDWFWHQVGPITTDSRMVVVRLVLSEGQASSASRIYANVGLRRRAVFIVLLKGDSKC